MTTTRWILLTTFGLAGGLLAALLIGMPLGEIVNAMIATGILTATVGAVLGGFQAAGLRRVLPRPIWWVVATAVGIGIGLATGVVIVEQIGILMTGIRPNIARLTPAMRATSLVTVGLVTGAFLGLAQWQVLRRQGLQVKYWIPVSAAGLATAFAASSVAIDLSGLRFASAIGVIVFVIASGAAFGAFTSWPLHGRSR